MAEGVAQSR